MPLPEKKNWLERSLWRGVGGLAAVAASLAIFLLIRFFINKNPEVLVETQTIYDDLQMIDLGIGVPVVNASAPATLKLSATAALAYDLTDQTILFEKNGTQILYPASTTKMMTALVALDLYQLNDTITIDGNDLAFGNVVGFRVGETLSVESLIKALLIKSSNEAALALAFHSPGGYLDFVQRMNQKVTDLKLKAHFANPAGFDDPGQQASAYDLAIIAQNLLEEPFLAEIVAAPQATITSTDSAQIHHLVSTNQLLLNSTQNPDALPYQIFGIKTGTTNLAQEALVTGIDLNGHRILIVVLGAKNRYNDTQVIADYILENVTWRTE